MSKVRRKVTVDKGSSVTESSPEKRKPSVFERLGPGGARSRYRDEEEETSECRNWMKTGNCPYGSTCRFSHPPHRRREESPEDLRHKMKHRKGRSRDRQRSESLSPERQRGQEPRSSRREKDLLTKESKIRSTVVVKTSQTTDSESEISEKGPGEFNERMLDFEQELTLMKRRQELQRELSKLQDEEREERENVRINIQKPEKLLRDVPPVFMESSSSSDDLDVGHKQKSKSKEKKKHAKMPSAERSPKKKSKDKKKKRGLESPPAILPVVVPKIRRSSPEEKIKTQKRHSSNESLLRDPSKSEKGKEKAKYHKLSRAESPEFTRSKHSRSPGYEQASQSLSLPKKLQRQTLSLSPEPKKGKKKSPLVPKEKPRYEEKQSKVRDDRTNEKSKLTRSRSIEKHVVQGDKYAKSVPTKKKESQYDEREASRSTERWRNISPSPPRDVRGANKAKSQRQPEPTKKKRYDDSESATDRTRGKGDWQKPPPPPKRKYESSSSGSDSDSDSSDDSSSDSEYETTKKVPPKKSQSASSKHVSQRSKDSERWPDGDYDNRGRYLGEKQYGGEQKRPRTRSPEVRDLPMEKHRDDRRQKESRSLQKEEKYTERTKSAQSKRHLSPDDSRARRGADYDDRDQRRKVSRSPERSLDRDVQYSKKDRRDDRGRHASPVRSESSRDKYQQSPERRTYHSSDDRSRIDDRSRGDDRTRGDHYFDRRDERFRGEMGKKERSLERDYMERGKDRVVEREREREHGSSDRGGRDSERSERGSDRMEKERTDRDRGERIAQDRDRRDRMERGQERNIERGRERERNLPQGGERSIDRSGDRMIERGGERNFERERGRERSLERDISFERVERGFERGSNRNMERGKDHSDRGGDRNIERGVDSVPDGNRDARDEERSVSHDRGMDRREEERTRDPRRRDRMDIRDKGEEHRGPEISRENRERELRDRSDPRERPSDPRSAQGGSPGRGFERGRRKGQSPVGWNEREMFREQRKRPEDLRQRPRSPVLSAREMLERERMEGQEMEMPSCPPGMPPMDDFPGRGGRGRMPMGRFPHFRGGNRGRHGGWDQHEVRPPFLHPGGMDPDDIRFDDRWARDFAEFLGRGHPLPPEMMGRPPPDWEDRRPPGERFDDRRPPGMRPNERLRGDDLRMLPGRFDDRGPPPMMENPDDGFPERRKRIYDSDRSLSPALKKKRDGSPTDSMKSGRSDRKREERDMDSGRPLDEETKFKTDRYMAELSKRKRSLSPSEEHDRLQEERDKKRHRPAGRGSESHHGGAGGAFSDWSDDPDEILNKDVKNKMPEHDPDDQKSGRHHRSSSLSSGGSRHSHKQEKKEKIAEVASPGIPAGDGDRPADADTISDGKEKLNGHAENEAGVPGGEDDHEKGVDMEYDPISDDELDELIANEDGSGEQGEDGTKAKNTAIVDSLDIDWSSLVKDTRPKPPVTSSALKRFSPADVLARIGVSKAFAGEAYIEKVKQRCQALLEEEAKNRELVKDETAMEEETELSESQQDKHETKPSKVPAPVPKFEFYDDIAFKHATEVVKRKERTNLLSNFGPYRRALCARRDLCIRRQLCKVDKAQDQPPIYNVQIDRDLVRLSVQLLKQARQNSYRELMGNTAVLTQPSG